MRLLNAKTLCFNEFFGDNIPKYAILSHRWACDELSYQEMCRIVRYENTEQVMGHIQKDQSFYKIYKFSRQALNDGHEYIWVDTCCIDKSSSAELQEAINSMYRWYKNSEVCYVYLSDVSISDNCINQLGRCKPKAASIKAFKNSQWFTRGWTLQELLAPQSLVFFDKNWKKCGTSNDLNKVIQAVTGIDIQYFARDIRYDQERLWTIRIARRMAWAANRQSTRVEDRAYSLLGLFDVNMPMLYGEGKRAFQRLQEEIIKVDDDASILAWCCTDADMGFAPNGLATSPDHFHNYTRLAKGIKNCYSFVTFTATMTPRGLQARLRIKKDPYDHAVGYAILVDNKGQYYRRSKCLILPIMFPKPSPLRVGLENECVRFSDPLWVQSTFVKRAKLDTVCFIRNVHAVDFNYSNNGFSIHSSVWKEYITTFTYPVQTQSGRRHFPAVFGAFSKSSSKEKRDCTFILELAARAQKTQRFAVLIDYQVKGGKIAEETIVTVISLRRALDLNRAAKLACPMNVRTGLTYCTLSDSNGDKISTDQIIHVRNFHDYWIHTRDDNLADLLDRPVRETWVKTIATIRRVAN